MPSTSKREPIVVVRSRQRGFTLVEVILVTAILGMVLYAAYEVLVTTLQADQIVHNRIRRGRIGQSILNQIRRDLEGLVYVDLGQEVFLGEDGGTGSDAEDSANWLTTSPVPTPPETVDYYTGDVASVGYVLKRGSSDEGNILFRRVKYDITDTPFDGGTYTEVYDRVKGLSFRYLDKDEWVESWDSKERDWNPDFFQEQPASTNTSTGDGTGTNDTGSETGLPASGSNGASGTASDPTGTNSTDDQEWLPIPRAVEVVLTVYVGDEKGLARDRDGNPIEETYSMIVPLLASDYVIGDPDTFSALMESSAGPGGGGGPGGGDTGQGAGDGAGGDTRGGGAGSAKGGAARGGGGGSSGTRAPVPGGGGSRSGGGSSVGDKSGG